MYIFVVLMCEKNFVYVYKVKVVLEKGVLLGDFLCEDYEINWEGCFMFVDFNIYGKWVLGMDVWELMEVNWCGIKKIDLMLFRLLTNALC